VGAGPVGLTIALLLQRGGIPFTLLEASSTLSEDLRASTFHPPTLDMLDSVGIATPLIELGLKSPTWQVRMHRTGERAVFDLSAVGDATGHPYRLQCEQSKLCRILLDRILAAGGDVRMGMRVDAVSQNSSGVRIDARGEDGEASEFTGRYVIGADGARSIVRRALDFRFEGSTYPETTILATTQFPFEEHLPGLSNVNYVWKDGGTFSLLRLPGLWRCSLYPDEGETIEDALNPESIDRKLQAIAPSPAGHDVQEFRPYRIHMRIVDEYRSGRVLLAGDAAHVNSPSGGMGMNGGIHDAFNLADKLAAVLAGADDRLLDLYSRQRQPIAKEQILQQAHRNRTRMQERDPVKRREELGRLQAIAADRDQARAFLLKSSMIEGLRLAETIQ